MLDLVHSSTEEEELVVVVVVVAVLVAAVLFHTSPFHGARNGFGEGSIG